MDIDKDIKGLIFDFDGTIFYLKVDWEMVKQKLLKEFGVSSLEDMRSIPENLRNDVIKVIEKFEIEGVEKGFVAPDAGKTLKLLADKYKIGIASRNTRKAVNNGLKKVGFGTPDAIITREDTDKLKPHPKAHQLILEHMDLRAEQVFVIGDTWHDVKAAHALGMKCVVVENKLLKFRPENGDYYIENLSQIRGILA